MLLCVTASVFSWPKLSHTQKKRQRGHEKRRVRRQELARLRDEGEDSEEETEGRSPDLTPKRTGAEVEWLNREAIAQTLFTENQTREEARMREKEALKQRIKDEFLKLKEGGPDIRLIKAADKEDREGPMIHIVHFAELWLTTQMRC